MKTLYTILFLSLLFSCSTQTKENLMLGNWKATSITDIEKGETNSVTDYMNVKITKDSMYVKMKDKEDMANGSFKWFLKNDSVNVIYNSVGDVQLVILKELTSNEMTVEMKPFLGDLLQIKYNKINSN